MARGQRDLVCWVFGHSPPRVVPFPMFVRRTLARQDKLSLEPGPLQLIASLTPIVLATLAVVSLVLGCVDV